MKQLLGITAALSVFTTCICDRKHLNSFCSYEFDADICIYNVECVERYEFPFYTYQPYGSMCMVQVTPGVMYQGTTYPKVNLKLNNVNALYSVTGTYGAHIIATLDLSAKFLSAYPTIPYMENLQMINMSNNALKTAIFSNQYELISLHELDLSNNEISSIEINTYHYHYKNLRKLNLAHNYIETIPDTTFYSLPELEYLDLSYNLISTLSVLTFEGLKNILFLNLSHNVINELNLALVRFNKLEELYLSNNQITHLKVNDLKHLSNLKKLDISSNALLDIENNLFDNILALQTFDLKNNVLTNIENAGFSNLTKLVDVDLSSNHLHKLHAGLFKNSFMSKFTIRENDIQGPVIKDTFKGMGLVSEIDLSYEKISSLEDYAFLGLDNVEVILLNNNNINSISKNSFKGIFNIRTIDLSRNELIYFDVNTEDLKNLTSLLLQYNFIAQVKKDIFTNLHGLQFLDLSNNNISRIEETSFQPLNNLVSLDIHNNNLTYTVLKEGIFTGLISLPSLDISGITVNLVQNYSLKGLEILNMVVMSHCNINEIQFNAFCDTNSIEILNLTHNNLTSFNINMTDLTNLTTLLLGNNLLKFIAPNIFKGLLRLHKIELAHNKIEILDENAFSDQKDITYLDLSYNPSIKAIPSTEKCKTLDISGIRLNYTPFLKNMSNEQLIMSNASIANITTLNLKNIIGLADLTLSFNNIISVEVGSFNALITLSKLDLSYNKISTIQPGVFIDNTFLMVLNISHNSLVIINYGIWSGLHSINTIDISYNNITDLESEKFYELKSLGTLIADYNKIRCFNATEFMDTNLVKLSIGNNPIPCQVLSKLRKNDLPFKITAIQLHSFGFENVNGIACNSDKKVKENTENSEILSEIRDILRNMASKNTLKLSNASDIFDKSNKSEESIVKNALKEENSKSVDILDKIIKTLTLVNNSKNLPLSPEVDGKQFYTNLELSFKDMKKYMSDINDKFSLIIRNKESANVANALSANEKKTETQSFLFLEVCIGLILVLLIACILFKLYSSVFKHSGPRFQPRRFSEEIENSDL